MAHAFTGNLFAKPLSELLCAENVHQRAINLKSLGLSGAMTFEWVMGELQTYHVGDLYTARDDFLDIECLRPNQLWRKKTLKNTAMLNRWRVELWGALSWEEVTLDVEDLFGQCRKSTMDNFLRFADFPPMATQKEYLAPRHMFIDFAWEIHCRRHALLENQQPAD